MEPLRTVIVSPRISWYTGGGERIPMQEAYYLALKGCLVDLVTRQVPFGNYSPLYLDFLERNAKLSTPVRIHEVRLPADMEDLLKADPEEDEDVWPTESFAFASAAAQTIGDISPDNVMHYYSPDGLFKIHRGNNIVYLLGNPPYVLQNGKPMIRMYDTVLAISREVQKHWSQYMDDQRVPDLLHTGVELPPVDISEHRDPTEMILYAGRLIERKGPDVLIQSFRNIAENYPEARLVFAGDGPERMNLERIAGELGLTEKVNFLGIVGPERLQELYHSADICVFPSRQGEGLMGVVLESMASGKAVVTTTGNGNEDVIVDGNNGILISPNDTEDLATKVNFLLGNPGITRQIGSNARKTIESGYTWEVHADKLVEIFTRNHDRAK